MTTLVKDVSEADFQAEVIERSKQVPVVVDFWAPWCGPCRTLGPLLEAAVGALAGQVVMVKVNTDANPNLSAAFGIQGIPAVKAFRNGVQVDEFVGALPAPAIKQFLARLVPSAAEQALEAALARKVAGDRAGAAEGLRAIVDDAEVGSAAAFHLAHVLVAQAGSAGEIRALAEKVHPSSPFYEHVESLERLANLVERARPEGPQALVDAVAANPKDHEARLTLAATWLVQGRVTEALDALLESVSRNPSHAESAAKKAMLAIFDHLEQPPANHDLVREYRRKLQIVS